MADGSTLPPSSPQFPIDFGTIDFPESFNPGQKLFVCKRVTVELQWNNGNLDSRYLKFRVENSGSRIVIQMTEHPTQTLWYTIYDGNLQPIKVGNTGPAVIGAQNEEINELFPVGNYYVRVETDGSVVHLPNNKNVGDILIRAYPPKHWFEQSAPGIINLEDVSTAVSRTDVVEFLNGRTTQFAATTNGQDCPTGLTELSDHRFQKYVLHTGGPAKLQIGVGQELRMGWPTNEANNFSIWLPGPSGLGWTLMPNGILDHPGGKLMFGVGYNPNEQSAILDDQYMRYKLNLSRVVSNAVVTSPSNGPTVIQLPSFESNDIKIGK